MTNEPEEVGQVDTILNISFGMLGINSAVVVAFTRGRLEQPAPTPLQS